MADESGPNGSGSAAAPSREPYVKPTIAWEEPLEDRPNLIAACAQKPAEDSACDASPYS